MSTHESSPLYLIFSSDGLLTTEPDSQLSHINKESRREEEEEFKRNFNVAPSQFLRTELSIRKRCRDNGVQYIPPKLSDSVDATVERKRLLNRAIRTAQEKRRVENVNDEERNAARAIRRLNRKDAEKT